MHRYKIVAPILLILSLINFLLAAPVVVRQGCLDMTDVPENVILVSNSEKRSDEPEKRRDMYPDEPWQKRDSSSGLSSAPPVGEPPTNQVLATDSPHLPPPPRQTGTNRIQDAASVSSPEAKCILEVGSNDGGSPGLASEGPEPDLASNEGAGLDSIMNHPASNRRAVESFHWDPHDWSETSSEAEPEPNFMNRIKSFFVMLANKFRFWPRGPTEL